MGLNTELRILYTLLDFVFVFLIIIKFQNQDFFEIGGRFSKIAMCLSRLMSKNIGCARAKPFYMRDAV